MMKKAFYGPCALVTGLVLAAANARATDYYVSTSGSDSSPGTSSQPFRTITHAYSYAAPGVTIHVAAGVYNDYTSGWGIHLGKSGTATSPIVLESTVVGGAIIDGQNASDRNQGFYIDGNYNIVDGFEIRNCPNGGISIWSSGNQILNNHIHNNGNPASSSTNGKDGCYDDQTTSGNIYAGNWINNNGRTGSNLDHGLYLCGDNEVVLNNVLLGNAGSGLQVAGYTTVSNMKVYNNVMAWNGTSGIILWQTLSGVDIKNNIIYQNGHYGVGSSAAKGSGVVVANNCLYGNAYGALDFTGNGSSYSYSQTANILSDPKLVNESSSGFDPHLASGSPCIGSGLNLYSTFTADMAGTPRPSSGAWDLGVYVSGSGSGTTDKTPPTVSISAPANGATVSGSTVTVSANASDNVGVAQVQFKLDGANLGSAVTASPYRVTWNTTTAANGSHTLSATAYDAAGNQASSSVTVTVNNSTAAPVVALTSPAAGASFTAPATISLAASVTANGHTITAVQFFNGATLLGQSTAAPYSFAWNSVPAGNYTLSAKAVYDTGSTVASTSVGVTVTGVTPSGLTFASTSGTISAPFFVTNGTAIVQPAYTSLSASGQAVYAFNVATAGNYVVSAPVSAPTTDNNSFWVNIDAQPVDPMMVWDVPVSTAFVSQTVSWRGNGTSSSKSPSGLTAQFSPKVFTLSAGTHQLIVRGREGKTQLGTITVTPTTLPGN